jgi:hypothetical protein
MPLQPAPRVYEVRRLGELAVRLEERSSSVAFIEVHVGNLGNVLTWLVEARERFPKARFVALLDQPLSTQAESWSDDPTAARQDVVSALLEAGASGLVDSPRHLHPVQTIAKRRATTEASAGPAADGNSSLVEWALNLLPWQEP